MKNKNKLMRSGIAVSIAVSILTLISSCTKEKEMLEKDLNGQLSTSKIAATSTTATSGGSRSICYNYKTTYAASWQNPQNPFDFVGDLHGKGIDDAFGKTSPIYSNIGNKPKIEDLSEGEMYDLISPYLVGQIAPIFNVSAGNLQNFINGPATKLPIVAAMNPYLEPEEAIIGLFNTGKISLKAQNYALALTALMDNAIENGFIGKPNRAAAISGFTSVISAFENNVANDVSFASDPARDHLFMMAAVARNSYAYWTSNLFYDVNIPQPICKNPHFKPTQFPANGLGKKQGEGDWWDVTEWDYGPFKKTAKADATGGFAGAVIGGATGSIAGGVGAGPGAATGAAVGAAGNSTKVIGEMVWDWFWED